MLRNAKVYSNGRAKKNSGLISQTYFIAIFLPIDRFLNAVFIRGGCQNLNGWVAAFGKSLAYRIVIPSFLRAPKR
jgi:hypothetical protein